MRRTIPQPMWCQVRIPILEKVTVSGQRNNKQTRGRRVQQWLRDGRGYSKGGNKGTRGGESGRGVHRF